MVISNYPIRSLRRPADFAPFALASRLGVTRDQLLSLIERNTNKPL
jgi:hypothetical protein